MSQNMEAMLFEPPVSHRFLVSIFLLSWAPFPLGTVISLFPSPLDFRFQKVSGLGLGTLSTHPQSQGGDQGSLKNLPGQISHPPLVLERGLMVPTPLAMAFNFNLQGFKPQTVDIIVMLLNQANLPLCTWTISEALPVKWETGELDATSNTALVNRMEFVYQDIHCFGAKV